MSRNFWPTAVATLAALCAARPALAVDVGDKAPEIAVSEWVQGAPVKVADGVGSRTLLLVFWRTFCEGMGEHFTQLDKIYKERKDKAFDVVALTPRDREAPYTAATLWITRKDGLARRIEIVETSGQTRTIMLRNVVVNQPISSREFRFSPPAGTQVVDQ